MGTFYLIRKVVIHPTLLISPQLMTIRVIQFRPSIPLPSSIKSDYSRKNRQAQPEYTCLSANAKL